MAHTPSPASPAVSGAERGRRDRSSKNVDQPVRVPGPATNLPIRSNTSRSPSLPSLIIRSNSSGSNPNAPYSPTRTSLLLPALLPSVRLVDTICHESRPGAYRGGGAAGGGGGAGGGATSGVGAGGAAHAGAGGASL